MFKTIIEKLFWRYCDIELDASGLPEDEIDLIFETVNDNEEFINILKLIALQDKDRYFKDADERRRNIIKLWIGSFSLKTIKQHIFAIILT